MSAASSSSGPFAVLDVVMDDEVYEYYNGTYEYYYEPGLDILSPCITHSNNSVERVVGPYIHSIICILGFVGNSLVIVTYALFKRTKSMTDVYLLNVAIADLLFVILLPLIIYNELWAWPMGSFTCKLLRGSYNVNLYSGMLLLACISTYHYIAIVQARRSFRLCSLQYSRLICAIVWVSAILLSVPSFYYYTWYDPTETTTTIYFFGEDEVTPDPEPPQYVCELKFNNSNEARVTRLALPGTQLAIGFFLPLVIMVFSFTAVIVTLLNAQNLHWHKEVRVVLVVVAVFIVCHLPYNVTLLYDTVTMHDEVQCNEFDTLLMVKTVTQTIAYGHCCLNPILYALMGWMSPVRTVCLSPCEGRSVDPSDVTERLNSEL